MVVGDLILYARTRRLCCWTVAKVAPFNDTSTTTISFSFLSKEIHLQVFVAKNLRGKCRECMRWKCNEGFSLYKSLWSFSLGGNKRKHKNPMNNGEKTNQKENISIHIGKCVYNCVLKWSLAHKHSKSVEELQMAINSIFEALSPIYPQQTQVKRVFRKQIWERLFEKHKVLFKHGAHYLNNTLYCSNNA